MVRYFPAHKAGKGATTEEQHDKIREEYHEYRAAVLSGNIKHAAIELFDLIHSAETMLDIYCRIFGERWVADQRREVELKNRDRGYYLP